MKVTLERLPESRVQLDIEVEPERVAKQVDAAYRRLAPKAKVPGFRPGKAPRAMTERYIGEQRLLNEAIDKLIPDVYNEAIETESVDAIAQPELDKVELDPMRFKFTVAVRPEVELGDYHSIRVEPDAVEVTGEMLDEQLRLIQRRYAMQVPVERPIQWDDVIIADVSGTLDDEDFRVERIAGKPTTFTLKVKEVKEEQLPDLDDDFASTVNAEEFPTFEALKERINGDLHKAIQEQSDTKLRAQALDKLVEGATIEFPRVLVDREIERMIRESMGNDQAQYATYLQRAGRSEEEYRETLRPEAETHVRRSLALSKLTDAEGLDAAEEEIELELDKLVEPLGDDAARFRDMFRTDDGMATLRRNIISKKVLDRLAEIATSDSASKANASVTTKAGDDSKPKAKAPAKPRKPKASAVAASSDVQEETE